MEPDIQPPARLDPPADSNRNGAPARELRLSGSKPPEHRSLDWIIIGKHGLRAGCSIVVFVVLFRLFMLILEVLAIILYPSLARNEFSPSQAFASELVLFLALLGAAALVGLFEHRRITAFYLSGPRPAINFIAGLATGFLVLSALIAALAGGGWLHFGPVALSGIAVAKYAALWGCTFLLVGCFEEGLFRSYLQFTFARSINFWWALGIVGTVCIDLFLRSRGQIGIVAFVWMQPMGSIKGNGMWGVFAVALLGLGPCLRLHLIRAGNVGFWLAAWVTSTLFGFVHVGNNGENWVGIFAAAAIGFVFCVSVWLTGSVWWAIGCHAGWDWGETYFYGTADSGMAARGHYLSTSPAGNPLWSGGMDGPEGSILVVGAILLLLVVLLAVYGRGKLRATPLPPAQQTMD